MSWVAVGVAGASLVGGLIGASGSEAASAQQVAAERQALAQQEQMWNQTESNESPFVQGGQQAQSQLNYLMGNGPQSNPDGSPITNPSGGYGSLNKSFDMNDFKTLTPQYGFNLQQGGQGTLNQDSNAQGAESGAALKDLMSFNQNFANNSFNSAFQNYNTQQNNIFNRLSGIASLGVNAGSNSTTGASQFAQGIGNTTSSIGASQAAGTVGAANAISGGIQSGANSFYGQNALNQILNSGSTTKYSPGSTPNYGAWSSGGQDNFDGSNN